MSYFQFQPPTIADRRFWDAVRQDERFGDMVKAVATTIAELPVRPELPSAVDFMAAKRHNDRRPVDRDWQSGRRQLAFLVANRLLKGIEPADPDDRLLNWLWAMTNGATWEVSAHLPGQELPILSQPVLALASCEFAAFLAETVEVLRPWMDSISANLAENLLFEVDRRVLTPFLATNPWWAQKNPLHTNNWTGVCAGSILAACRSFTAQGRPRPEAESKAIDLLNWFWRHAFTPQGECDEGMGYWIYGVLFAALGMSRLTADEYHRQFDSARVAQVAAYPRMAHLSGVLFFNGNDSSLRSTNPTYLTPWLAAATGEKWLLNWPSEPWTAPGTGAAWKRPVDATQAHFRHIGMVLRTFCTPVEMDAHPKDLPGTLEPKLLPDQQAGIFRSDNLIVCMSGGTNAESHNHNDLGHFQIIKDGLPRVIDLGAPGHYTADFFGPKRYEYMIARSRGHNVPVINDVEQIATREAAGKIVAWEPGQGVFTLDLTAAYPASAKLASWIRTLRRSTDPANPFTLEDVFHTAEPGVTIELAIWTLDRPAVLSAERVRLGDDLVLSFTRPTTLAFEEYDPAAMALRDFSDKPVYRLAVTYATDGSGNLTVKTTINLPASE